MYVKYQMPLIAVSDVGRSKRFYCGLFDQRVVLDFGENVTFSGGFAIQEKFAWLTGLAEDSVRSRPNNMELYFETDDLAGKRNVTAEQLVCTGADVTGIVINGAEA